MNITAIHEAAPSLNGHQQDELRLPNANEAARGLGVTFGPSVAMDGWWVAGLAAAVLPAFWRRRGAAARAARLLLAAGAVAPLVYHGIVRPRILFWGATRDEMTRELPGDAILPNALVEQTRAITIHAPAAEVWRWLVQIGYRRGGWYSYDRLEAAAGAGEFREGHSATRIYPELQHLRVGDLIRMSPWTGMRVAAVTPNRLLVLHSLPGSAALLPKSTWTFLLDPLGADATRFIVRGRSNPNPRNPIEQLMNHMIEMPHFLMERRMMLGIKARAEESYSRQG